MFNQHFEKARQIFSEQFVREGDDYIYRKSSKGAPVRVTAAERDGFIGRFHIWLRYASWGMLAGMLIIIMGLVLAGVDLDTTSGQAAMYVSLGFTVSAFMGAYFWAWNMPMREIGHRPILGSPLSKSEARAVAFAKITYGQLAFAAGMGVLMLFRVSDRYDIFHGWGVLWLIFSIVIILAAAAQAVRKWLFERSIL